MDKEKNLNFDVPVSRRGTGSLKYDYAVQRGKPADVLPLWVADMDFMTSSYIQEALEETVRHGIWGYSEPLDGYFAALDDWMWQRHSWHVKPEWVIRTPGVVFALAMAVRAFTEPGEAVLIEQPVYYPFSEVIADNGRRIVSSDLVYHEETGTYTMDLADVERKIIEEHIRLFLLCSPHNPVGRVWTAEELAALGKIAGRHGVIVVSDEIHADFVFHGRHQVFARAGDGFSDFTVTCTSPSKTFNLAGLQISNIIIENEALRQRFAREVAAAGYSQAATFGLKACEAAYRHGRVWYEALLVYLKGNIDYTVAFVEEQLPGVRAIRPEGTYLVWLDFTGLGLSPAALEELIVEEAGLWLDSGAVFGKCGEGFERINVACPRSVLAEALKLLKSALDALTSR